MKQFFVIFAAIAVIIGVLLVRDDSRETDTELNAENLAESDIGDPEVSPAVDTSAWMTYSNAKYGFSFRYPKNYRTEIEEQSVGGQEDYPQLFVDLIPPNDSNYGEFLQITVPNGTSKYVVPPAARLESETYVRAKNEWYLGNEAICIVPTQFGVQEIPAYHFGDGDAGSYFSTHLIITSDAFIEVTTSSSPVGELDPNLPSVLSSFTLSSPETALFAKCNK